MVKIEVSGTKDGKLIYELEIPESLVSCFFPYFSFSFSFSLLLLLVPFYLCFFRLSFGFLPACWSLPSPSLHLPRSPGTTPQSPLLSVIKTPGGSPSYSGSVHQQASSGRAQGTYQQPAERILIRYPTYLSPLSMKTISGGGRRMNNRSLLRARWIRVTREGKYDRTRRERGYIWYLVPRTWDANGSNRNVIMRERTCKHATVGGRGSCRSPRFFASDLEKQFLFGPLRQSKPTFHFMRWILEDADDKDIYPNMRSGIQSNGQRFILSPCLRNATRWISRIRIPHPPYPSPHHVRYPFSQQAFWSQSSNEPGSRVAI